MNKLAIFGGSGMTGLCVVEEALSRGLSVQLLLRDPSKVPTEICDKVSIIRGNVLTEEDVQETLKGVDGVIVTLGTRNDLSPTTDLSNGLKNIISAMKNQNLKNISVVLSAFLFYDESKVPGQFVHLNADHRRMLENLSSSGLDYVAVLPPHIADQPKGEYIVQHDKVPAARVVSKRDLAAFLIDCLVQPEHYGQKVGISSK